MRNQGSQRFPQTSANPPQAWVTPSVEVISLDCEITAYAPDGDSPLF